MGNKLASFSGEATANRKKLFRRRSAKKRNHALTKASFQTRAALNNMSLLAYMAIYNKANFRPKTLGKVHGPFGAQGALMHSVRSHGISTGW